MECKSTSDTRVNRGQSKRKPKVNAMSEEMEQSSNKLFQSDKEYEDVTTVNLLSDHDVNNVDLIDSKPDNNIYAAMTIQGSTVTFQIDSGATYNIQF